MLPVLLFFVLAPAKNCLVFSLIFINDYKKSKMKKSAPAPEIKSGSGGSGSATLLPIYATVLVPNR